MACAVGTSACGGGFACRQPAGARLAICVPDEATDGTDGPGAGDGVDGGSVSVDGADGTDGTDAADGTGATTGATDGADGTSTDTDTGRGRSSGCTSAQGDGGSILALWLLALVAVWARRVRAHR